MRGAKEEWAEAEIDGLAETVTIPTVSSVRGRPAQGLASRGTHADPAATSGADPSPSRGARRLRGSPADDQSTHESLEGAMRVRFPQERSGQGKSNGGAQRSNGASAQEQGGDGGEGIQEDEGGEGGEGMQEDQGGRRGEGMDDDEGVVSSVQPDWRNHMTDVRVGNVESDGVAEEGSQGGSTGATSRGGSTAATSREGSTAATSREGSGGVDPTSWVHVCGGGDVQLLTQDGIRRLGPPALFNQSTAAQARDPAAQGCTLALPLSNAMCFLVNTLFCCIHNYYFPYSYYLNPFFLFFGARPFLCWGGGGGGG